MFGAEEPATTTDIVATIQTYSPYALGLMGLLIINKVLNPIKTGVSGLYRFFHNLSPISMGFTSLIAGPLGAEALDPKFGLNGSIAAYSAAGFLFVMSMIAQGRRWTGKTTLNPVDVADLQKNIKAAEKSLAAKHYDSVGVYHTRASEVLTRAQTV